MSRRKKWHELVIIIENNTLNKQEQTQQNNITNFL